MIIGRQEEIGHVLTSTIRKQERCSLTYDWLCMNIYNID